MGKHEVSKNFTLKINGEEVKLNKFVASFLEGAIRGILRSLKDVPKEFRTIEIVIDKTKEG